MELVDVLLRYTDNHMRFSITAAVLSIGLGLCTTTRAQIPLPDVERLAGPWECRDANGIHGMVISGHTRLTGGVSEPEIVWQHVTIRVYRRLNSGATHSGYFTLDADGGAVFDGNRLRIELARELPPPHLPPFSLEAVLEPDLSHWSGRWSLCENPVGPLLERPQPAADDSASVWVGIWERRQDAPLFRAAAESLHVWQSADGVQTAVQVLSRGLSGDDADHFIHEMFLASATESTIRVGFGEIRGWERFEGTLSRDGNTLSGRWIDDGGTGIYSLDDEGRLIIPDDLPAVYERRD